MLEVAMGRISNELILKKNWREYIESYPTSGDEYVFGADAVAEPDYGIFGVAYSNRTFDYHPLDQRYVQLAFDTIRAELGRHSPKTETDSQFLGALLLPVGQAFAELNVPPDDFRAAPWVCITLARLQGKRLSYARMGDVRIYVIEAERCLEITPWWPKPIGGKPLKPGVGLSGIEFREWEAKPGELVVVATFSMEKVIHAANLSELVSQGVCAPQLVSQRLIDTLRSLPGSLADPYRSGPGRTTEKRILSWGAAWAVACVEAKEVVSKQDAVSKRSARKVESPTPQDQEQTSAVVELELPLFNLHLLKTELPVKEYEEALSRLNWLHAEAYLRQLPAYVISHCPICSRENIERLNTYSVHGWHLSYGKAVFDYRAIVQHCEHFTLAQPFFHFRGIWPAEAKGRFSPEVPYVIGHLLESGKCLAVIHALPVCRIEGHDFVPRYTLFIVSYFSEQPESAFESLIAYNAPYLEPGVTSAFLPPGGRDSSQGHWWDLPQWVSTGQLYWVDGNDPALEIRTHEVEIFPYGGIRGRDYFHQFPYPLPESRKLKSKRKAKATRK